MHSGYSTGEFRGGEDLRSGEINEISILSFNMMIFIHTLNELNMYMPGRNTRKESGELFCLVLDPTILSKQRKSKRNAITHTQIILHVL